MKFSIVVPIYNVENYIEKCLKSIQNQTYKNFEVILVNDGSTDKSEEKITSFLSDKRFIKYKKENGGLSDARNYGIKYANGNYLLFIDSDDYIDKDLLQNLNNILEKKKYDLIKFNFIDVIEEKENKHQEYLEESKEVTIKDLINFDYFEPACSYCYNLEFYKNGNFKFEKNRYHEDYGLIPMILTKAKSIYYLNFYGYYYVKRENSIVNNKEKSTKKAEDTYYFSMKNIGKIKEDKNISQEEKDLLLNFYANGAIRKITILDSKKEYKKKLKKGKIEKYLLNKTIKQKIKKGICRINYELFIKLF